MIFFFALLSSYYVLDIDVEDTIEKIEGIRWQAALGLSVTWFLVYLANFYPVKTSAKVRSFSANLIKTVHLGLLIFHTIFQ